MKKRYNHGIKNDEEYRAQLKEDHLYILSMTGLDHPQVYYPEDYGVDIPKKGAWIMINKILPVEIPIKPLSIYYAMPEERDFNHEFLVSRHMGKIITKVGSVSVWPYEYVIVKDIGKYIEEVDNGGAKFNFLSETPKLTKKVSNALFYLRSRGISNSDAFTMVLGVITKPNVGYLTMRDEYCEYFTRHWDTYLDKVKKYLPEQQFNEGFTEI